MAGLLDVWRGGPLAHLPQLRASAALGLDRVGFSGLQERYDQQVHAGTAQKTAAPSDSRPEPNSARSNAFLMKFCQGGAAEKRRSA